jgi:hypothetical protein
MAEYADERIVKVLQRLLAVETLRLNLDAAKTLEWSARQVTDQSAITKACREVLDGN